MTILLICLGALAIVAFVFIVSKTETKEYNRETKDDAYINTFTNLNDNVNQFETLRHDYNVAIVKLLMESTSKNGKKIALLLRVDKGHLLYTDDDENVCYTLTSDVLDTLKKYGINSDVRYDSILLYLDCEE